MSYTVGKYKDGRTYEVRDGDQLVAVTVYKKGATNVADLLTRKDAEIATLKKESDNG